MNRSQYIPFLFFFIAILLASDSAGAYHEVSLEDVNSLDEKDRQIYRQIESFLRQQLSKKSYFEGRGLGIVTKVEQQVVAGTNYRYTFTNQQNERITATVFDQPWNKIRKLTHITTSFEQQQI